MIEINPETGTVTWGDFVFYTSLTHDALVQNHPSLMPFHSVHTPDGRHERRYRFPVIELDQYPLILDTDYYNQRLSGLYIRQLHQGDSDDENLRWQQQLPEWVKVAQSWLTNQLGQPHRIEPGVLFDEEKFLTTEQIQLLQIWSYEFEWGTAGFYYDGLQMPGDIYVHYDYHKQIRTWGELAAECETLLRNQQKHSGFYINHLMVTRSLIDMLSQHFEFQNAKPFVGATGLVFPLDTWKTKVVVSVRPNDAAKRYEIFRHDTTAKSFIADGDHLRLVKELHKFLETETM